VRAVDEQFEPPPGDGALVYVSLGSLGSADVALMNRLVDSLAETPHRYVVSKGPQHESIELAPNMTGSEFLPQPAILPQADLVITHGGNNTVTESIHFGKPMVVLPLFWDQYDNAQRIEEVVSACGCRRTSSRTASCMRQSSSCWPRTARALPPPRRGSRLSPARTGRPT
jgi:UDP:flavonoid glycosyltransferase YjiC (YdhE family)